MTAWLLITLDIAALGALAWAACFATLLAVAAIEAHWRASNRCSINLRDAHQAPLFPSRQSR